MTADPGASGRTSRQELAELLEERLTPLMSALGVLFLLVVLAEPRTRPGSTVGQVLIVLSWGLWAVFALEYAARLVIATDRLAFLRRTWWQLLFLVLPFLRFLRLVRLLRLLRTGRVLSSAIRSSARPTLFSLRIISPPVSSAMLFGPSARSSNLPAGPAGSSALSASNRSRCPARSSPRMSIA